MAKIQHPVLGTVTLWQEKWGWSASSEYMTSRGDGKTQKAAIADLLSIRAAILAYRAEEKAKREARKARKLAGA